MLLCSIHVNVTQSKVGFECLACERRRSLLRSPSAGGSLGSPDKPCCCSREMGFTKAKLPRELRKYLPRTQPGKRWHRSKRKCRAGLAGEAAAPWLGGCEPLLNPREGLCRAQLQNLFLPAAKDCVSWGFKSPAKALDHLCWRISSFPQGFLPTTDAELGLFFYMYVFKNKCLEFIPVKGFKFEVLQWKQHKPT